MSVTSGPEVVVPMLADFITIFLHDFLQFFQLSLGKSMTLRQFDFRFQTPDSKMQSGPRAQKRVVRGDTARGKTIDKPDVVTNIITMKTKVRKIGNSLGIVLPKEALEAMHVEEGSALYITRGANNSLNLMTDRPGFAEHMKIAQDIMKRYRNALRELAK